MTGLRGFAALARAGGGAKDGMGGDRRKSKLVEGRSECGTVACPEVPK